MIRIDLQKQAFILRLENRQTTCLTEGVVGLGWVRATGLDKENDWYRFREIIRQAYPESYSNKERALGNAAGSLWRFFHRMKVDDYVLSPVSNGFLLAQLTSEPYYDERGENQDFTWRRHARWLVPEPIARDRAGNLLQRRMKARQTCVDASDLIQEIENAVNRHSPPSLSETILKATEHNVAEALRGVISDRGLEKVIASLSRASGAVSQTQAKNSGKEGDVDVMAVYDLRIGNQESIVRVAYQVKQHEGVGDEHGIKQLVDRMEADSSIARGCFVTLACEITASARKLAEANDIIVLTQTELVEWVLMAGLRAITEYSRH